MKTGRKISGGKYKKQRKRRIRDLQGQKKIIKLGETRRKVKRTVGGNKKVVLYASNEVNVRLKTGKTVS